MTWKYISGDKVLYIEYVKSISVSTQLPLLCNKGSCVETDIDITYSYHWHTHIKKSPYNPNLNNAMLLVVSFMPQPFYTWKDALICLDWR